MARHEADREDLWAEAVAMTSRAELAVPGEPAAVIIGYRDNGWCSIYLGPDVMLQFTAEGGLRRAYRQGELFRSQGNTLARLQRHRKADESSLLRSDLSETELAAFKEWTHERLRLLAATISAGQVTVLRELSSGGEAILPRIGQTLETVLQANPFLVPRCGPLRSSRLT